MRLQLAILLATIKQSFTQLLTVVGAFFLPISGILFLIGFAIVVDTITGIWKAKKLKIAITSRKLSTIISKMMLYEVAVIGFYLIDYFILNDIIFINHQSDFVGRIKMHFLTIWHVYNCFRVITFSKFHKTLIVPTRIG